MTEPKEIKAIQKQKLTTWLEKLQDYIIYSPVRRDKYTEFSRITDTSQIDLTVRNTYLPPKEIIFAQTKAMFKFDLRETIPQVTSGTTNPNEAGTNKQLVIGLRPCDAHAFAALDKTFDSEFKDSYYLTARKNTVLIGLACLQPDINCFCASVGFDPFSGTALDILMVDLGDSYLLKIYTENGQQLLEIDPGLFTASTPEQLKDCDARSAQAMEKLTRKIDTPGIPEKLDEIFEDDYWEKVVRKCLGCGICTYLCPTCYCFDITDENRGGKGERVRTWDSCMYPEYTVHASGYNPRPARMNRLRNRMYHKFKYYPNLYEIFGCVGCGRCIRHCPVNIDIIDIMNGVKHIKAGGSTA